MRRKMTQWTLMAMAIPILAAMPVQAEYDYNKVLQLDGNGDYVQVHHGYLPQLRDKLTVDAWIKTSVASGDQAIISRYKAFSNSNTDDSFLLSVSNGRLRFQINPGNTYVILDGSTFIADGRWHHVAGIYDGNSMRLLVDGRQDGTRAVSGNLNNPYGTDLRIGALYDGSSGVGFFFNGQIDEVHLWDHAIAPWESHKMQLPIRNRATDPVYTLYPVYAWRFNGYPDSGFNPSFNGNATEVPGYPGYTSDNFHALFDPHVFGRTYLNIYGGSSFPVGSALTVEAWVYSKRADGDLQSIVSKFRHNSNSIADDSFFLGIEPNGVARFQISVGNNWRLIQSTTTVARGPHHLAGVFDGSYLRLYVDGQLERSTYLPGSIASNQTPLYIGGSEEGPQGTKDYFFSGMLDDVRIWNVARSQAQIQANMQRLSGSQTGLLAWWNFEGDFINLVNYRFLNPRYWGTPVGPIEFCGERWACWPVNDPRF